MMKSWTSGGRRRAILLFLGCFLPLLFIAATTSFFHPQYFDPITAKVFPKPQQPTSPSHTSGLLRPWEPPSPTTPQSQPQATNHPDSIPYGWQFELARDERNFGLNDAQCDSAFPGFYKEVDRAVEFRKTQGQITEEEVDISWRGGEIIRVMIYDRQLYIVDAKWAGHGFDLPRALALLNSIQRSIVAYQGPLPNIEFSMCMGDWPGDSEKRYPLWVLTRRFDEEDKWVIPDFGYWSWPIDVIGEYSQVRRDIEENEPEWNKKDPRAVWRGATQTNQLRDRLVEVSEGKKWSDIHRISWENRTHLALGMDELSLSMPEHCNYQYVVHTEGHTYSGRGKYLLNCNSVSIVHKPEWIEPHTHLFISSGPDQNMVEVERDFSDLNKKMRHLIANSEESQTIAENAVRVFRDRYLTPAAQACYWRKLFHAWSTVSFEPELYRTVKDDRSGHIRRKSRGVPFETFVSNLVFPPPPQPKGD